MSTSIFHSPFTTALSGSAKETEDRIRNIFQYQKKRPPVPALLLACALALSCGGLVSCQASPTEADISYPPAFFGLPGEPLTVAAPAWASASESLGEPPLWTTNNGQVMQASTQEEYEAGGTPYGDEDGYLFYRF